MIWSRPPAAAGVPCVVTSYKGATVSKRLPPHTRLKLPPSWVWLILLPGTWAGCSRLPALRPLALDGLAPAIQSEFQEAYQKASNHPRDPLTNGRYAMLCHAYQRWEAAEVAYQRAVMVSPQSFEWQ